MKADKNWEKWYWGIIGTSLALTLLFFHFIRNYRRREEFEKENKKWWAQIPWLIIIVTVIFVFVWGTIKWGINVLSASSSNG